MGYKEDLEIDKFALDEEWLKQASCFMKYAESTVEAEDKRDRCKERLVLVEAEMGSKIRTDPQLFGLKEKTTEASIKEALLQTVEYMEASDNYLSAVKEAKILGISVQAFDHKKRALTKLTDLFLSNYWAGQPGEQEIKMLDKNCGAKEQQTLETNPRLLERKKRILCERENINEDNS